MTRFLALMAFCSSAACALLAAPAAAQSKNLAVTDHLTVSQWVNPATPGELSGQVILPSANGSAQAIANAVVVMTNQDGEKFRGSTDENGQFVITGVQAGVYALTARADGVFACCAMHVVDGEMVAADQLPQRVDISAAAIDYTVVKTSILRYLPPARGQNSYTIDDVDLAGISDRVAGDRSFRVSQSDGGLKGRLHIAGARGATLGDAGLLNVFLVHQGEVVDRVVSLQDGTFVFVDVAPGEYSILALGQAGLGMAGFELIDESTVNQFAGRVRGVKAITQNDRTLTSIHGDPLCCREFAMQVAPLPQAMECCEAEVYEEPILIDECDDCVAGCDACEAVDECGNSICEADSCCNPLGGAGFSSVGFSSVGGGGGGGGGGAGGGGFGGGFLGLAGLAGLAGLGGGDDPIIVPPDPVSPVR